MNGWVNNGEAGDLRRHLAQHDVIVMWSLILNDGTINVSDDDVKYWAL